MSEGFHLFANGDEHHQSLQTLTQVKEHCEPLHRGVRLHDQLCNRPALLPQFAAEGVLMVATEVPDDLLKIDRQFHRLLVDRQMLLSGH